MMASFVLRKSNGVSMQFLVIGAGAWGTTLALLLARNNQPVQLWSPNTEHLYQLMLTQQNQAYLPGINLPESLTIQTDLAVGAAAATDILLAIPSAAFANTLRELQVFINPKTRILWATKGLVPESGLLLHQLVQVHLGEREMAVLSGPNFAREIALGLPAATTIAANSTEYAKDLLNAFHNSQFRVYTSTDMVGVEIAGATKNVMAIAAGIADGFSYGANARAALITRGLAEISKLGVALGAQAETFMGLAGMGDLVLTCTDDQSRNRRLGLQLAAGLGLDDALDTLGVLVEGVHNAKDIYHLAQRHDVEMPITEQIYKVLYENLSPAQAVTRLLERVPSNI